MFSKTHTLLKYLIWLPLFGLLSFPAFAQSAQSKVVESVAFYLGVVPTELVRGHPKAHVEGTMHGGPARGEQQYHVVIALFDGKTGSRISDAQVTARVASIGLAGSEKPLESMRIADAMTYGNFFDFSGTGPFRITVKVRKPNEEHIIETQFEYKH